ncbi:MAG: AI-2E family transporter YdiK [Betaproteobacteria bacterium]|jgi:predicted PurR-regulated permease PerM|nr:AI-2E family transporter YdiK [Betaproteobacteria bacterium]MDH4293348.1 AI-2E family transporter YdiK [Betaproteobacteria bacterium]MDH5342658.1 AI-2E family transporter YdiK [Betaproteobacteria bacterium]
MSTTRGDLTRTTLAVLFIGGLILSSFWIMRPFLAPLIWATMIVVATWPLMRRVQTRLWGRRSLATIMMVLALLLVFIVPLTLAISTIVDHADDIVALAKKVTAFQLPPPPEWLGKLPLIGDRAVSIWETVAADSARDLLTQAEPYVRSMTRWFLSEVGSFGLVFVQSLLTVILAAVLYANGELWAAWMMRFGSRLANVRGEHAVVLAGQAIRGVALGVVVTALAQSVLGGIGLAIAGVPLAGMLTALMFMLCIAQLGPILVLIPAVGWLYWSDSAGWGTFLLVWSVVVGTMDNFLRPYLIKQGADLPLLLIFAGVIGGMLSFGLVGIFVGPVVLAVAYTLIDVWVNGEGERDTSPARKEPAGTS